MRIAHITPVYPPYTGGIGNVAHEYALALARDNNEVTVFTPRYSELHDSHNEVEIRRLKPWYKWGNAALLPQLLWELRKFDVLHLHYTFYGASVFTALASVIWRKPLIITYHMKPVAQGWLGWIFRIYRWIAEPFVFMAAKVVCVSSLDYAQSVGLRPKKLIELPFSVDAERFHIADALDVREKLGIGRDAKVIIFVGGLDDAHYFKGVDVLIEACARLTEDVNWHLIVVGDGSLKGRYQNLADQKQVKDRMHFVGRLSHSDLPKYYQAADIHVLPAINRCEAFGLVTLEAAASGLPSIVSNLPGVRTLVKERETGLVVPASDIGALTLALRFMLQKDDLRQRCGQNARSRVERRFAPEIIHKELKDVYKSVGSR